MLVEYIYLLQQDEAEIKNIWHALAQKDENITLLGLEYEIKSGHFSVGCIQKAESQFQTRLLYFYHNLAIIVLEQRLSEQHTLTQSLLDITDKISGFDNILGRCSILINPSDEKTVSLKNHFNIHSYNTTQFPQGELHFYLHDLHELHSVMTFNGKPEQELLLRDFSILMANVINLTQKTQFYRDQNHTIANEKKELDAKIGLVMQQHFTTVEDPHRKIQLLEDMVNSLAEIYSTLSSDVSVLLQTQATLEKDFHITSTQLQKLTIKDENFLYENYVQPVEDFIKDALNLIKQVQISIGNAKTSIDILQAQINLIRSNDNIIIQNQMRQVLNQNLELQQEAVTLQVGAGLIEFIVVMYYSLSIWKTLAPDSLHHIPVWLKFGIVFSFAGLTVWGTHKVSKYITAKKHAHKEPTT